MTVLPTGVFAANVTIPAEAASAGTPSGMKNRFEPFVEPGGYTALRSRASRRSNMMSTPRCALALNGFETTAARSPRFGTGKIHVPTAPGVGGVSVAVVARVAPQTSALTPPPSSSIPSPSPCRASITALRAG